MTLLLKDPLHHSSGLNSKPFHSMCVEKAYSTHSPTLTSLHLHHSSFSTPSTALPKSQFIPQRFCCFTYVIGTSPMPQLIFQPFCCFIYATARSTTLPPLHLILQHLHLFTYITAHSPPLLPLYLCQSSFYSPSVVHIHHRHFTYITAHSPSLLPLHLRHRSFYNPSVASPTS